MGYEWTPGKWVGGTPRQLTLVTPQTTSSYVWKPQLNFDLLEQWVMANVEQIYVYLTKSEVICESNYVTTSLNVLVCDCLGGSSVEGVTCYTDSSSSKETLMGLTSACAQETTDLKGPSSSVQFGSSSITYGCVFVNLSLVYEAWFQAPPTIPTISFRFQNPHTKGIVLNTRGATVGELVGDGTVLTFSKINSVGPFSLCLRVNSDNTSTFPIREFGYSTTAYDHIYPLGVNARIVPGMVMDAQYWCISDFSLNDIPYDLDAETGYYSIRVYPIVVQTDYQDPEFLYVSSKTLDLMYTLGVSYCVVFSIFVIYVLGILIFGGYAPMPFFISILFLCVCVFRACFMFMYPNAIFDGNPLAEYIVFEIPTFLLFSVVIISIGFWKRLAGKKDQVFLEKSTNMIIIISAGLFFVWSLWIIITVVYAEAILNQGVDASDCPGRVPDSYERESDNIRTLAIVYQAIIITITFILTVVFFYYAFLLFSASKHISRAKRFVLIVGGVLVGSFLLRCILFIIVLSLDLKSAVYMFITLFITEVLMMLVIALQFTMKVLRTAHSSMTGASDSSAGSSRHSGVNSGSVSKG